VKIQGFGLMPDYPGRGLGPTGSFGSASSGM
jgi:hypothetical protein